jgi:hypothetical protein
MQIKKVALSLFVVIAFIAQTAFGFQKVKAISVDAAFSMDLNLSEIAQSVEMVALEASKEQPSNYPHSIVLEDDFIFISTIFEKGGKQKSSLLQYDRKGNFVRQMGNDFDGWISVIHDPINKRVGASSDGEVVYYDYRGTKSAVLKTVAKQQIYFNNYFFSVESSKSNSQRKYTLTRTDLNGSNIEDIFDFYDKKQSLIGSNIRFSKVGDQLYFWDNFSHTFYKVKGNSVEPSLVLKLDEKLISRLFTEIKGDWIVIPALDQRRKMSVIKYINLKSQKTFGVYERIGEGGKPISGTLDDILGAGTLRYFDLGPVYGDVDNKLVFIKKKADVPQLNNSAYPDDCTVLFFVTLK